jgi:hypothetical protein
LLLPIFSFLTLSPFSTGITAHAASLYLLLIFFVLEHFAIVQNNLFSFSLFHSSLKMCTFDEVSPALDEISQPLA